MIFEWFFKLTRGSSDDVMLLSANLSFDVVYLQLSISDIRCPLCLTQSYSILFRLLRGPLKRFHVCIWCWESIGLQRFLSSWASGAPRMFLLAARGENARVVAGEIHAKPPKLSLCPSPFFFSSSLLPSLFLGSYQSPYGSFSTIRLDVKLWNTLKDLREAN